MRIAHLTPCFSLQGGGVPPVVHALAAHQKLSGNQICVFSVDDRNAIQKSANYELVLLPVLGSERFAFAPGLIDKIVRFSPDILHSHGIWSYFSIASQRAAKKLKIPHVISTHGMLEPWAWNWHRGRKRMLQVLALDSVLKKASALLAYESEMPIIKQLGFKDKTFLVVNGVDIDTLSQSHSKTKFELAHPEFKNKKIILFLSRLHPKKGLPSFLNAFSKVVVQFPEWHFVIAGPDESGHAKEIAKLIRKLNLMSNVSMLGIQIGESKRDCFAAADLFVLPSFSEGFSVAVLEAMASGLPVLISKGCCFQEVEEKNCGIVCEANSVSIEKALKKILSMGSDELKLMGQNGRQLITEKYTWSKVNHEILDIYQKVIHHYESEKIQKS